MTVLKLIATLVTPIEAGSICPDQFQGKTTAEIARMPLYAGRDTFRLGDFFNVADDGSEDILVEGDAARLSHIGEKMMQGRIILQGNAGAHLGAGMKGGEIHVAGDAADWAGAEMAGGLIRIHGNAGHGLGAAYRGSRRGMNRGRILVDGNAGGEAGTLMRRGLIAICGDAGEFTGRAMIAGTIVVFGHLGPRPGAEVKHGTIVAYHPPDLLPTYRYDCLYQPGFLSLVLKNLCGQGVAVPEDYLAGRYRRYSGDFTALGKGEILVYDQRQ
jgi:formylmethanofuran dehydrogenase subunit C